MKIHFSPDVAHDRDVVFDLLFWFKGSADTTIQQIVFTVENGEQLFGVLDSLLILYPNKLYLVNNSFKVGVNGTLIIKPGVKMLIYPGKTIPISGKLFADGKPDSLIYIKGYNPQGGGEVGTVFSYRNDPGQIKNHISYCKFENISWPLSSDNYMNPASVYNCIFYTNWIGIVDSVINNLYVSGNEVIYSSRSGYVSQNNFLAPSTSKDYYYNGICPYAIYTGGYQLKNNNFVNFRMPPVNYQNFTDNYRNTWLSEYSKPILIWNGTFYEESKQILTKYSTYYGGMSDFQYVRYQYWGTTDSSKIEGFIEDFMEVPTMPRAIFQPNLNAPPDSCHGIVWKVQVNGIDPQDEYLDPIGVGAQKFEVYFNRPMDTAFIPQLSFGVRYPFTQQNVTDSANWSTDRKIWTAYKNIQLYTGDGINRLRVTGAKDLEGWEIPVEDMRFEFVINAAGSASTNFMAQAGIGKVYLEWNNAGIEDLLGFNMYRFRNITDTTYSTPVMINTSLITDTTYTDFAVTPGEHYWYYYKVVNTDFRESDSSNLVNAIPYNAPMGDANGDESVNVLDITSLVAYMLDQNPQPFLFDAADVNDDNTINILDVIGVVNIITGKMKSISTTIETNPVVAHIKLEEERIVLQSDGQVASMQFELAGETLENIKLVEPPAGFELAYGIVKGKLLGILYTSYNKNIPAGDIPLVKISGTKSPLELGAILAGDDQGKIVPVIKETPTEQPKDQLFLQAYPNPFSQSVTINFSLPEDAQTMIKIFNLKGRLVNVLTNAELKEGMHWIDWNGSSLSNRPLPSGIYLCKLEAKSRSGKTFNKEIKVVYIK